MRRWLKRIGLAILVTPVLAIGVASVSLLGLMVFNESHILPGAVKVSLCKKKLIYENPRLTGPCVGEHGGPDT